jgi:hypothetical protein
MIRSHNAHRVFGALALGLFTESQLSRMLCMSLSSVEYALAVLARHDMARRCGTIKTSRIGLHAHQWKRLT